MTAAPQPEDVVTALAEVLAPLGRVRAAEKMLGGTFATTYLVTLEDGTEVIAKTAPMGDRQLTYETDLVRSEAFVYRQLAGTPGVPVPRVLLEDWTRTAWPSDVLVVTRIEGTLWWAAGFEPDDPRVDRARHELGRIMARIHATTGDTFGYVRKDSPLRAATWPEAFTLMVEAALEDAVTWGVEVPDVEIRAALARHRATLAEVETPVLVHTDLWPGNVFLDLATGEIIGIIDAERALWGDPLIEVVGIDQESRGPAPAALLEGYVEAGGTLVTDSPGARTRLALYRMYFMLFQSIEVVPREFSGDWVEPHVRTVTDNLRAALDALA